jgi:transposase-like protein
MQFTTKRSIVQVAEVRVHIAVVLSILVLALLGRMLDSQAGWIMYPPQVVVATGVRWRWWPGHGRGRSIGHGVVCSQRSPVWYVPVVRSMLLWVLWQLSGQVGPGWVGMVPWVVWLWQSSGQLWPRLRHQPEWQGIGWLLWQVQRGLMVGYLGLAVGRLFEFHASSFHWSGLGRLDEGPGCWMVGLGCAVCGQEGPWVEVVQENESYRGTICGHFSFQVDGDHPFRRRLLMLFLRMLEVPGQERASRRTRDGRRPFVRQQYLAQVFRIPQPDISREERYWLEGDWPNLLSLKTTEVLTGELMARIVTVFATFPWWGVKKVYQYLRGQEVAVSERQVRQAAEQSGWSQLRRELVKRYHLTAENIRPRDGWLVEQLLAQNQTLLTKLEAGEGLTPEERVAVADLRVLAAETGIVAQPPLEALPWLMRVERVVFGHWEEVTDGTVRCIYCGSTHVSRKSRKPRSKKYYDAEGNLQTVEVYRYYCYDETCSKKSFTNLPPGLVPYSRYRTETRLLAMQMYVWGYSTYRRTGQALGVASMTVYRWVSAWGYELLPVAALFGVVRSSGVVGIDEKYVLVPKNDKPEGKMRRWMYVYLAVDVYTYDLLHIAIYPHNNKDSAHDFLLDLRAKGYHPKVVVTDQRQDYGPLITLVFPGARHHECIFHALQNVQDYFKEVYGADYAETHPEAVLLKQEIYHIFDARTKRTAQKRYDEVMAMRERYIQDTPDAATIFGFLERHWLTLVNGIESKIIPRTNNTVELVIRRFDQHYQNFCGFDTIETARLFLGVFEKVYRFTPFSRDAQPRIRDKCPLELAGYDISQVPMASLCAGLSVTWPLVAAQNLVPNP